MPSSGQQASTTKPGASSLIAWWWIELTMPWRTPGYSCASREPRTSSTPWKWRSKAEPSRCARDLGRCVAMSCSSVPPNITLSSCRPRQMPNTGLPARTKASISSIS
jgi:hypothetical protein